MRNSPPEQQDPHHRTIGTPLGILGAMVLLYWLAMQFAGEQVEHAWTRIRGVYELKCLTVSDIDDGLSHYAVSGCGRSAKYACSALQVTTPVYPIQYGISCSRSE